MNRWPPPPWVWGSALERTRAAAIPWRSPRGALRFWPRAVAGRYPRQQPAGARRRRTPRVRRHRTMRCGRWSPTAASAPGSAAASAASTWRLPAAPTCPTAGLSPRSNTTSWRGALTLSASSWPGALAAAGEKWRRFRATEETPGVGYRPPLKTWEWLNTVNGLSDRFPVGATGLPIVFKKENEVVPVVDGQPGRRPSPIWFRRRLRHHLAAAHLRGPPRLPPRTRPRSAPAQQQLAARRAHRQPRRRARRQRCLARPGTPPYPVARGVRHQPGCPRAVTTPRSRPRPGTGHTREARATPSAQLSGQITQQRGARHTPAQRPARRPAQPCTSGLLTASFPR